MNRRGNNIHRGASKLPSYIVVPAVGITSSFLFGYWYFQDEAPFTGRKRLLVTSPDWERRLGDQEYRRLLKQHKNNILPSTHQASMTVQRVGKRISTAADTFIEINNTSNQRQQLQAPTSKASPYTYTVVRSQTPNAFVLPNNHVFVLTGLFRHVQSEDDLAAVLGHEMAHNLARHAGERMSGGIIVNILARLSLLIDPNGWLYSIFLPGSTLLHELPHSREHEIEADHIGIHLAADACYDPRAAKRVFEGMKLEDEGGDGNDGKVRPMEFMSTHPSYVTRIENFDMWMHDAMDKFRMEKCRKIRRDMTVARHHAVRDPKGSGRSLDL